MTERELLLGVLATQVGFVTPAQVMAAASAHFSARDRRSLLDHLVDTGALTPEKATALQALADQALNAEPVTIPQDDPGRTIDSSASTPPAEISNTAPEDGEISDAFDVPFERPEQYRRLDELGRGGQSVVWRALDRLVGREVAMKELTGPPQAGAGRPGPASIQRFLREARLVASLDHPGIVPVLELVRRADGTLVCVQKLVVGETLKARFAACRGLEDRLQLLPHLIAACQAVGYAHAHHVVHRDLKPSNIMVGPFGQTVVVDWGLAKRIGDLEPEISGPWALQKDLTVVGTALGTPEYMSPEQARGEVNAIDERTDVFNLGAILFELLAGRPPHEGASPEHVISAVREGRRASLSRLEPRAPRELVAVADRALAVAPEGRYASAEALAIDLAAYAAGRRVEAYRYQPWELLRKFAASHRAILTGVAIAGVALLLAGIVVAVRLHLTRVNLASSFLHRAYDAEQAGDWSAAAAYFAAARAQHDSTEGRWGLAAASERITERILSRQGPAESFADVGVLPDGRVVAVGHPGDRVEVREAESGKALWTRSGEPVLDTAFLPGGVLRLSHPGDWAFHDAATGRELGKWLRSSGYPCSGPYPPLAVILKGQLLRPQEGGEPRVIATDAGSWETCVVSEDGLQVAYQDDVEALHLLSLESGRELARRKFDPFQALRFSRLGLVVFRRGRLDVLGGPEGDFSIELPEAKFGTFARVPSGGSAVAADGELVAIASQEGGPHAVLVDLRNRSVRGVIHYSPGWPRLAFSIDEKRIFAAGMNNQSGLSGWTLPPDDTPKKPRWWYSGFQSRSGRSAVLYDKRSGRFELYRQGGTLGPLTARGVRSLGSDPRFVGDGPVVAFIADDFETVVLHDLEADRVLGRYPCHICSNFSVSEDGSRLAMIGADGLEVWDTRAAGRVFQETRRAGRERPRCSISRDGRLLAWTFVDAVIVRDLDTGKEVELPLDGSILGLDFGPDMVQLVTVTTASIALRDTQTGRKIWSVANDLPDYVYEIFWSPDRRALSLLHGYHATEVLDVATGERLAWFQTLNRAVTPVRAELYTPDLRWKSVVGETTWDTRPVPQPDATPAAESLTRILRRTGLEFRGVEVVAAP